MLRVPNVSLIPPRRIHFVLCTWIHLPTKYKLRGICMPFSECMYNVGAFQSSTFVPRKPSSGRDIVNSSDFGQIMLGGFFFSFPIEVISENA